MGVFQHFLRIFQGCFGYIVAGNNAGYLPYSFCIVEQFHISKCVFAVGLLFDIQVVIGKCGDLSRE